MIEDEYELVVDRMAAELKASGNYPPSLEMLDRACVDWLVRGGMPRPYFAEALLRERTMAGQMDRFAEARRDFRDRVLAVLAAPIKALLDRLVR